MNRSTIPSRPRTVGRVLAGIGAVFVLGLTVGAVSSDSPTAGRSPAPATQVARSSTGGGVSTQGIARW